MKPARSPQWTACLPTAAQTALAVATTSGAVAIVETTSTSFITGAGLKKWRPTTSDGRDVAAAHSITGNEDVVVASTAPGRTTSSSAANTACFTESDSATASTTRSTSASASKPVTGVIRAKASTASSSDSLPLTTALSSDFLTFATEAWAFSRLRARSTTSRPRLANTSAMPVAIVPVPTTPTRATGRGATPSTVDATTPSATTFGESGAS